MTRWALMIGGLFAANTASAVEFDVVPREPGHLGIGLGVSTRTSGVSLKYTADPAFSIQGVVGIDSGAYNERGGTLALAASALFEMPAIYENDDFELGWALGAGPYIAVGDNFWLGAHGVAALEFNIRAIPLEITLEYRPSIELIGPDQVGIAPIDFGGHIRWWL